MFHPPGTLIICLIFLKAPDQDSTESVFLLSKKSYFLFEQHYILMEIIYY